MLKLLTYRQYTGRYQGAEVASPERFQWEVVGHFLPTFSIHSTYQFNIKDLPLMRRAHLQ